jgi:hypothetical protein
VGGLHRKASAGNTGADGMNCKPGDLAVVVNCIDPDCVGSIVRCEKFQPGPNGIPAWIVDRPISKGGRFPGLDYIALKNWIADACLHPIRPDEGEDEMLRITGKPEKVNA